VLIETQDLIAYPLYLLFKKSLKDTAISEDWKQVIVTSISKNGNINSTQLNVYLPILENIDTIIEHQMAGCQRGLSLSKLATHGYNNVISTHINA